MTSTAAAILVPTKKDDGGSKPNHVLDAPKKQDAFAKYSSTLLRMKHLLLLEDSEEDDEDDLQFLAPLNDAVRLRHAGINNDHGNDDDDDDTLKRRKGNDSRPIPIPQQGFLERKTRLSWEVHPSLLFHHLMYRDVDDAAHISDDEDDGDGGDGENEPEAEAEEIA